jgi:hypothetical protein
MSKIFGTQVNTNSQVAPVPGTVNPVNTQLPATPGIVATEGNGVIPDNQVTNPTENDNLESFKDLWAPQDPSQVKTKEPIFNIDPAKLAEAAKNNDFSSVVTKEQMAAINAGGEGGQKAMLQIMNAMSQKGFSDSTMTTAKIVEAALQKQQESFMKELPNIVKNQNLSDNLRSANPVFNNPAVAPVLEMMKNQVSLKFPNATAAEQQALALQYVEQFATAVNPAKQITQSKSNDTDWAKFLGE